MSTQDIRIDLNFNKNFIHYLQSLKSDILRTLTEVDSNLIQIQELHYKNNIGHSQTFYDTVQTSISEFTDFTSMESYLNYKITNYSAYTIWKPIFNRDINYDNEQGLLDTIYSQISIPFLSLKQVIFYFSLIWIDSPITTLGDSDSNYTIQSSDSNLISADLYYLGIVNYMSLHNKKYIYNAFSEFTFLFNNLFLKFNVFYAKITKNNESLDSIRTVFQEVLHDLYRLSVLFQNAKDELNYLTVDSSTENIIVSPDLSLIFREYISQICSQLTSLQTNLLSSMSLLANYS